MSDIIHVLPDSVANQIAAGEVVQRPASALKELLENAIDAGASDIKVIVKQGGKALIQVIDNGCGMSETDARLSFERHATSKIKTTNDLFCILTMGFRGEALASIAAVAQVEMKSKRVEDELGTCITVEGSKVKNQQPCGCQNGTSVSVKNLFYNVPARRNFLKSNSVETRHILEEFQRIAIINPGIACSLFHNDKLVFQLPASNQKTRIVNIMGSNYSERLVSIEEETEMIKIKGFIGKPQYARKTRGEQYFFTNSRYMKHPYFHHAVENAFEELIPDNAFPTYFINLEVDPKTIDVNIHPTKTEINFQHQQVIYAIIKSAVKKAIGSHSLTPSIDFDVEQAIPFTHPDKNKIISQPVVRVDPDYNPFDNPNVAGNRIYPGSKGNREQWEKLYDMGDRKPTTPNDPGLVVDHPQPGQTEIDPEWSHVQHLLKNDNFILFHNRYVITNIKSGLLIVDIQRAHERILYEKYLEMINNKKGSSQQLLFPQTVEFSPNDTEILLEIINEVRASGFEINEFGKYTFIIDGAPEGIHEQDMSEFLESVIENYKKNINDLTQDKKINFARSLAKNSAIKKETRLSEEEMNNIIDELFACQAPEVSPDGKRTHIILNFGDIEAQFKN